MIVPPWVKPLVAVAVVCGAFGAGWYVNGMRHENASLRADADRQEALNEALDAERRRADRYSQQVVDLLQATPPVTHTVRELTRAYPSPCTRPAPVTDSLHQALSRANQAIAAAGGNGALPADAGEAVKPDGR